MLDKSDADVIYGRSPRLSTPREAPDKFIGPQKFGELIYDNFLVDVPRIMDLCALFRHSCPKILSKMVASVFKHRPTYSSDLAVAASNICQSMSTVSEKLIEFDIRTTSTALNQYENISITVEFRIRSCCAFLFYFYCLCTNILTF